MKTIKVHQLCLLIFFTALIAVQAQGGDAPAQEAPAQEAPAQETPTQESNPPQQAVQTEDKNARFSHRRFRGDLGIGVAYGDGRGAFAIGGEFKYAVIPNLYLGIGGYNLIHRDLSKSSFFAVGDYFFTEGLVRPYVGLGLGVIGYLKNQTSSTTSTTTDDGVEETSINIHRTDRSTINSFVIVPRAGVDIWHFRLGFAYELEFSDDIPGFFTITAGAVFGGGKKRK